jgi:phospholipid/cholesterol/gamma-HCH transport system ATP-binding protein
MAPRPHLLLFDDPTTGLDPILATTVDDEVVKLRDLEHATAILVTHQIRDGFYIATHDSRMDEWNDIPQGLGVAVKDVDASATLRDSQVGDRQGGGASKS